MINYNDIIIQKNIELLLEGFYNKELPPIFDYNKYIYRIINIFNKFSNGIYSEKINREETPAYTYNNGIEPIVYYDFKKNNTLREMMLPCFKSYIIFMYKTIGVFEILFKKLYSEADYAKYVFNSNSNLLSNDTFCVTDNYDMIEEEIEGYFYQIYNNKRIRDSMYTINENKILNIIGTKQYYFKVDIESFYPNVYSHLLRNLKNNNMYKGLNCGSYFDFLDEYNMKINNDQTKGIVTGIYSSVVSSELLMLTVDNEIRNILKDNVGYIRYVDDMLFSADSKDDFYKLFPKIQEILNKYGLRINPNKIEVHPSIYYKSYTDIIYVRREIDILLKDKKIVINRDNINHLKHSIISLIEQNDISTLRALLSYLRCFVSDKLIFDCEEYVDIFVKYLVLLAFTEPLLATRCYMILDLLIENENGYSERILNTLLSKTLSIDDKYNNTILQIWHYYLLIKYKKISFKDFIKKKQIDDINPIIISFFVEYEKDVVEIFKNIKRCFCSESGLKPAKMIFMQQIMCSKWWMPIMFIMLKNNDKLNKYFNNNYFDKFYKEFI